LFSIIVAKRKYLNQNTAMIVFKVRFVIYIHIYTKPTLNGLFVAVV